MCLSSPKPPAPPPPPPPPPPLPKKQDPQVKASRAKDRQQAALAAGRGSTVLTGASGLTTPATRAKKTALGA